MNARHFKSLSLEKTGDAPQHGVIASFEEAQELGEMTEKACIELQPEKIGASQAPDQHDALAPLPAKRAKK